MKQIRNMITSLILLLIVSSCTGTETPSYYLSEEIPLRQLVKTEKVNRSENGYFFLITGGYSSREEQAVVIRVFAKVEGMYRYLEFPIENIRININKKYKTPTIQFKSEINYTLDQTLFWIEEKTYSGEIIINCSEEYLPEKLLPIKI
jgi:hypothetical protein